MALCLLSVAMASSIVNYFLFKPPESAPYSFPTDTIRLKTSRGNEIAATFIDRPGATITLLLSHGNSEDLNGCYNFMLRLSVLLEVNVLGYDYSGYGQSTGMCGSCYRGVVSYSNSYLDYPLLQEHQARTTATLTLIAFTSMPR